MTPCDSLSLPIINRMTGALVRIGEFQRISTDLATGLDGFQRVSPCIRWDVDSWESEDINELFQSDTGTMLESVESMNWMFTTIEPEMRKVIHKCVLIFIFKVSHQNQETYFRFSEIIDIVDVTIDTKIKSATFMQPELRRVIQ